MLYDENAIKHFSELLERLKPEEFKYLLTSAVGSKVASEMDMGGVESLPATSIVIHALPVNKAFNSTDDLEIVPLLIANEDLIEFISNIFRYLMCEGLTGTAAMIWTRLFQITQEFGGDVQ